MKTFYQVEFNEPNKVTVSINDGLRLVLVLRSRLIVWKYNEKYEYQKGDIFIVNHREQFRFIENKDTLYISIHLTESYLKQYIDDYNNKILILEKGCLQEVIYKQIVNAIAMIGVVNIRKGKYYRLYIEQQLINLMFIIVRFLPTKMNESYKTMLNDYRVEFVCNYIQSNYTNDISLTKVAKKVALSTTYLSKIFTQQMGMGFNQYLIHIRLEHCKEDLIYTDNTIVLNFNIENQAEVHIAKRILEDHKQHIDSIAFCANQNDIINFQSIESDQFNLAKKHITLKLKKIMEWLDVKNRKISFTLLNWNTLTGDTNLTNGEYFRAGIIFEQLIEMNGHINMIGYWLNFEIHQKYSQKDIKKELNGIDLYHQFDGKRPAFFTSMFFKKLLKNILYRNGNCIALGNTEHFQIVLWDAEHYNPYFTLNDSSNDLNHKEYQINIFDLLPGTYKIKHLTLDKNHGALYKIWQQYNTQHGMDEETINYVNRVSFPKLDVSEVDIIDTITYHLKLLTNAIQIIEFRRYFDKKYN